MDQLTNQQYRERKVQTPIGNECFSYLTEAELHDLRHAIHCAYPSKTTEQRNRTAFTYACQPTQAAKFVNAVNFSIKVMRVSE